jgi:hypothetical protein
LYRIYLKAAHEWGNPWYAILDPIHESINQELERKHKTTEEEKNWYILIQNKNRQHGKLLSPSHQQNRHNLYQLRINFT